MSVKDYVEVIEIIKKCRDELRLACVFLHPKDKQIVEDLLWEIGKTLRYLSDRLLFITKDPKLVQKLLYD